MFVAHIAQEDLEGVPKLAVRLADLGEESFAEGHFILPIDRGDPKAENVGAVLVVEVRGVGRLALFLGVGFGSLLTGLGIDDEAVGENGLVGSLVTHSDGEHKRALEPSAVLVGSLEIEVGRATEFGMSIHHGDVAGTGVDPNVEGVAALRGTFGKAEELGEFDVGFFEPNVGAFFLDEIGDLLGKLGGDDGLGVSIKEDRKRHTPGPLTGDTPVGTGFDRAVDAVAAPLGQPLDLIDFAQGFFSELVDGDEELLDRAEDDGGLGTPTMWVAVLVGFFAEQCAFFLEEFNDGGVRFEDVDTYEIG